MQVGVWDLKGLVDEWLESTDEAESWPWLWCQPNPNGPHHLFIGASRDVLVRAQEIMKKDARCNITCIVNSSAELEQFAPLSSYYKAGCAVIEVPVRQFDVRNKILMLEDERILCFDHAYVA